MKNCDSRFYLRLAPSAIRRFNASLFESPTTNFASRWMTLEQIRFDLPRMKASSRERSSESSRTLDAFSAIENSRLSRRREKKSGEKYAILFVRRRTELREIAIQPMHFVRSEKGRSTRRAKANFRPRFTVVGEDGRREISGERDGFLPTTAAAAAASRRGALKNAGPGEGYLPVRYVLRQCHFFHCLEPAARNTRPFYKSAAALNIRKLYCAERIFGYKEHTIDTYFNHYRMILENWFSNNTRTHVLKYIFKNYCVKVFERCFRNFNFLSTL